MAAGAFTSTVYLEEVVWSRGTRRTISGCRLRVPARQASRQGLTALQSRASPRTSVALPHRTALCLLPLESQPCSVTSLPADYPAAPRPPTHPLPIASFSYALVFTAFPSVLSLRPVAAHQSHFGGLLKSPVPCTTGA